MSNLEFVKKLYNGKNCYSDHMSAEELGLLYLKSKVEDIVSDMLDKNRIIFLTGNPGDGKTFIIKALQEKVITLNVYVQSDLNKETKYESMASDIISCYSENRPAIIAANEYPFLRLCRAIKAQSAELYNEIASVKKSVISYEISHSLGGKIAIIDLNERDLLAKDRKLTEEIIKKLLSLLGDDTSGYQVLNKNIVALSNESVCKQMVELFNLAAFGCEHYVTRDILGALSFTLTACTMDDYSDEPYYSAIFVGNNKLLKSVQQFDPIYLTTPTLDEQLWNGEILTGWLIDVPDLWPNDKRFDEDIDGAVECFKSLKRKYYFEHTDGQKLLSLQPDELKKCAEIFTGFESQRKKIKERIIHSLNKLFLPSADDRRDLHIWTTHKYDMSHDAVVAVSSKTVESNDLEILMPRPADWIKGMEYTPDHIILKHRDAEQPKLVLDIDFLRTLNAIESGYPIGLLAPQYEQAAAIFLQQLDDQGLTEENESTEIIKNYLIFDPTSNSTKPPHIANGLFRLCTGETCDTKDVHEWIVSERRSNSQNADKILSSADIVEKYQEVLQEGNLENPENIKKFRFLLEEVFNQDNTVYPEYAFSTMTISSHWLVKGRISSEAHIGDFLYGILCKEVNGKRSPAIDLIRKALKNDSDDLTKLINPIIAFPSQEAKRHLDEAEYLSEDEIKWDACKAKLREGFDRLALNIQYIGEERNTLLVLRRMICFAGFATFAYLTHANHAIYNGVNPPIVVDSGGEFDSIKKASEQSYTFAKKAVEDYFVNTIYGIIKSEIASSGDDRACKKWIDEMTVGRATQEDEIKGAIKSYYNSFCEEGEKPIIALSRALQIALYTFEYRNNSPSDYCRVLGTRCGLIGPKGNRAKVKRYLTNSFTLETITLSILSTDDLENGIELKELSEKAISAYNLLLGANADEEYSILEGCNIAQATPGDLRGDLSLNAQRLADTYISLGLAKRYADGVTLIGWRL